MSATLDMSSSIVPKSDQINADDLIAGPRTVTITRVSRCSEAEQPIAVNFEGDGGKPYKPCKSMRRMMVYAWGVDAAAYAGRSMTLYRDPAVTWGGMAVGGIRISHMSHIDRDMTVVLAESKAKRKPVVVRRLVMTETAAAVGAGGNLASTPVDPPGAQGAGGVASAPAPATPRQTAAEWLDALDAALMGAMTHDAMAEVMAERQVPRALSRATGDTKARLDAILAAANTRVRDYMASEPDPNWESDGRDPVLDEALGTTPSDFPGDRP
jgi:hypothetical protein